MKIAKKEGNIRREIGRVKGAKSRESTNGSGSEKEGVTRREDGEGEILSYNERMK